MRENLLILENEVEDRLREYFWQHLNKDARSGIVEGESSRSEMTGWREMEEGQIMIP